MRRGEDYAERMSFGHCAKKYREEIYRVLENAGQHEHEGFEQKLIEIAKLLLCKKNHQSQCDALVSK